MTGKQFNEEFKIAAVQQVIEGGYSIEDAAKRLGICLYNWRSLYC
jgi:transposase